MQTDTTTQPLYKVLNQKRTPGKLIVNAGEFDRTEDTSEIFLRIEGDQEIFDLCCFAATESDNAKIDAQYTALAVNNLHKLAEVLESFVEYLDSDLSEAEQVLLIKAKAVLQAIS